MVPTWNSLKLTRSRAARRIANAISQSITTRNGFTTSRCWTPLERFARCDRGGGGGSNSGSKVDRSGPRSVRQGFRLTGSRATFPSRDVYLYLNADKRQPEWISAVRCGSRVRFLWL